MFLFKVWIDWFPARKNSLFSNFTKFHARNIPLSQYQEVSAALKYLIQRGGSRKSKWLNIIYASNLLFISCKLFPKRNATLTSPLSLVPMGHWPWRDGFVTSTGIHSFPKERECSKSCVSFGEECTCIKDTVSTNRSMVNKPIMGCQGWTSPAVAALWLGRGSGPTLP